MNLSVVILTKNEEKNIRDCLKSVSFADEVIIIDDYSEDKTVEKCQKSIVKCQVYRRKLNGNFAAQRNFGIEKARGTWVLFIDADELVSRALRDEIIQITGNSTLNYSGLYLRRTDHLWGQELKHGETGNVALVRLAKRNAGKWKRRVHEVWDISGRKYTLKNSIMHSPHPSVREFIAHIGRYSTLHAIANKEERKSSSVIRIIIWPIGKFIQNYIFRLGFLDGIVGFIAAMTMSFSSFLSWSKLQILQHKSNNNS